MAPDKITGLGHDIQTKEIENAEGRVVALASAKQRDLAARQSVIDNARGGHWKALQGSKPVGLMELRKGVCRWPINASLDEEPMRYCGCLCAPEASYCDTHKKIAFAPIRPRVVPQRNSFSAPTIKAA